MSNNMKIAIYTPYLDTAGGGEKYMLIIAEALSKKEQVDVLLDKHLATLDLQMLLQKVEKLHKLDLSRVKFIKAPIGQDSSMVERALFLRRYDLFFCMTDGSLFYATAKKNIIHFQVPFKNIAALGLWGYLKQKSWDSAIYNSNFTKNIIEKSWSLNKGQVFYPPVDVESIKPLSKKKIILSVGRFTKFKKHEVMIGAFKKLSKDKNFDGWSLNLVGGAEEGAMQYVKELQSLAGHSRVQLHPNLPYEDLIKMYGESSIYWHAMGYNEVDPAKMEHFGISTVEAMAAGAVPVVINLGGQREIVDSGKNGFLWDSVDGLISYTKQLIKEKALLVDLSKNAQAKAAVFSKKRFVNQVEKIAYEK